MNATALAHHTKLLDWCDTQRLQHTATPTTTTSAVDVTKPIHLPPEKLESVGKWCTEVNRLFIQPPKKEPPKLFRKCRLSDFNIPNTLSTKDIDPRKMSASSLRLVSGTGRNSAVQGALLAGKSQHKPKSAGKPGRQNHVRFQVQDEENRALAAKMADTIQHYTEERKIVHLNIHPKWQRKLSTGWTINRPLLYPKVPPPAPSDSHRGSQADSVFRSDEEKHTEKQSLVSTHDASDETASKGTGPAASSIQITVPDVNVACEGDRNSADDDDDDDEDSGAEHSVTSENGVENGVDDKATQWEPAEEETPEVQKEEHALKNEQTENQDKENMPTVKVPSPRTKFRAQISDRSPSNDILNFISVDDCKMVMRYRPRRVIDTQDTMVVPSSAKHSHAHIADWDRNELTASSEKNSEPESGSQNTPIRLSQGTGKTTLSPSQVQSRVQAYRTMYKTYSNRKAEDKVQRPSSAAVEKAFEVLLDRNLRPPRAGRVRPHSSPPVLPRARPGGYNTEQSSPDSSLHQPIFEYLNAKLRRQMYEMVDTQWYRTKLKFQRSKSGNAKTKIRPPEHLHQPRMSWVTGEEVVQE